MSGDISLLVIQPVDVLHAIRKWDGRDVVTERDTRTERRWQATDREFLEGFSTGKITGPLLSRFAANNNNNIASKRTGGYSIVRKFWGGVASWMPRLQGFYTTHVLPARVHFRQTRKVEAVWELTTQLAEMKGQSTKGFTNPLGIVAASKLLFFACPEMPIFIYDSFVGAALSVNKLPIKDYPRWWHHCNDVLEANSSVIPLLPKDRKTEFPDKEEWITRRSIDLMLYRFGEKIIQDTAKQSEGATRTC